MFVDQVPASVKVNQRSKNFEANGNKHKFSVFAKLIFSTIIPVIANF